MMTRKDYVATAEILRLAISDAKNNFDENSKELFFALENVMLISEKLAEYFLSDNKNFDEEKFFTAIWAEKING